MDNKEIRNSGRPIKIWASIFSPPEVFAPLYLGGAVVAEGRRQRKGTLKRPWRSPAKKKVEQFPSIEKYRDLKASLKHRKGGTFEMCRLLYNSEA
jgi:hypothetical protein